MRCIIRKGYAYYWQGRDRLGGDVVEISEEEYKKKHWIFEPPAYAEKVLAEKEPKPAPIIEQAPEELEVQNEVVDEGIINNRAIIQPGKVTTRRKK